MDMIQKCVDTLISALKIDATMAGKIRTDLIETYKQYAVAWLFENLTDDQFMALSQPVDGNPPTVEQLQEMFVKLDILSDQEKKKSFQEMLEKTTQTIMDMYSEKLSDDDRKNVMSYITVQQ